ncbi:hypothetical protein CANTEDRAFT_92567 [Yamadazyma tenuis ATCC 10573]|uniref:Uncharacterized protein n=2 Tax=Candida tenuis TaxID=2315449 RepID=G3B093_CANTC|nr:uncharacterized protein CANTEDRAFT_92567 [Yamadazyma tenuis ATCC 10573]EGV65347.1 hypothetical protein CANTEDRAFT_92567 [Yamadazyma tenuis ATCC 10573]
MDPNCEEIQLEDDYVLILHLGSSDSAIIHQRFSHVVLIYMLSTVHSNDLPYFVVQTLLDYLLYADLHPYQYEELDEQIPIEVIQVSSGSGNSYEAVAEMCSEGFNRFSNNIFNVTAKYSKVAKSQVSPQPHRFYFEVLDTGTPKTEELPAGIPNDSVFQLVLPADSMLNNETTGKFEAFFDDIYASLASELPVSIHPSNNVNIRLGALLKHSVLRNINKILDRLAQNPHHPAQKPILANVRGFISQLQQYPVPWKRLHQETTNTLKSTCL